MRVDYGIVAQYAQLLFESSPEGVVVVTDTNVAKLTLFQQCVQPHPNLLTTIILPAGEATKSWPHLEHLIQTLATSRASRKTKLLSIGGGVVSDIAGFAASIYRRGMPFYTIPTTLLAQIDAAIGGKNGINMAFAKNAIGTFYQPADIVIDSLFLQTLPGREFQAGLAEMIKYGLIADAGFFAWLEENLDAVLDKQPEALTYAITCCAKMKTDIVSQDEKEEKGLRQLLNFGHTLGHALEAATGYDTLLHGEAVAIGMAQASRLSEAKGFISEADLGRILILLDRSGLPTQVLDIDRQKIIACMGQDKKNDRVKERIVLLSAIGSAHLVNESAAELLILPSPSPGEGAPKARERGF